MIDLQPVSELLSMVTPLQKISGADKAEGQSDGLKMYDSFASLLKDQLVDANSAQIQFEDLNKKLVLGEVSDVHSVVIAGQKANMSLEFMMSLRNMLLNVYNQLTMLR